MSQDKQYVLINGEWRQSAATEYFQASNPAKKEIISEQFPVSPWPEIEDAINASAQAFAQLRDFSPEDIARFLENYADRIEARTDEIVAKAAEETGLPPEPRLKGIELPRTTNQLRMAAVAARDRSWSQPTIDSNNNLRSMYRAIGPVIVFGPNNFPLAFNGVSGGDFAAAIAAGNPVIAKANTSHPGTTRPLAEEALGAIEETGMPSSLIQLIYRTDHEDGKRMVSHPLVGATGYTGSRKAGLALKEGADKVGKPIYLELSSINPVVILPGALKERAGELADEFVGSVLMGAGQFCTNPGLVILLEDENTQGFISDISKRFEDAPVGTLLGEGVENALVESIHEISDGAGAKLLTGGSPGSGTGYSCQNTLMMVDGSKFIEAPEDFQKEAFGNASLLVVTSGNDELNKVLLSLEGNLTGCVYSHNGGEDDELYKMVEPVLRSKVGRLLNDKMPTGVLVSPAMNHGGPFPATGHPGFTAVGIPASLGRFSALHCYDEVRHDRLPPELQNKNPTGQLMRSIDGQVTANDVS